MINTIANHKKLVIKEVEEFENIIAKAPLGNRYRHFSNGKIIWMTKSIPNIRDNYLYHPVKNIDFHKEIRQYIFDNKNNCMPISETQIFPKPYSRLLIPYFLKYNKAYSQYIY
jgi:hypothetical protein